MKILCINPPEYTFHFYDGAINYPIGLYNIATYYKNTGNDVEMLDLHPEIDFNKDIRSINNILYYKEHRINCPTGRFIKCGNYDEEKISKSEFRIGLPYYLLREKLESKQYDLILVQCTFTYYWKGAHEVINMCKKSQPNVPVWFGGIYTNLCFGHAKKSKADKLITGKIDKNVNFITTDHTLFPYAPYKINIITSIGCKNKCKYCAVSRLEGTKRIERSVSEVLDDIKSKIDAGYRTFAFLDSNILDNWNNHFKKILKGIIGMKAGLNIKAYGGVEPPLLTDEAASMMKEAGFSKMTVPLESSNKRKLIEWNRPTTIDSFHRAINIALKYFDNSAVTSFIMIGYRGQTYEDAMDSIKLCENIGCVPDLLAFTPIPGTLLEDKSKTLEELNPMLWPYAWKGFTVEQMEIIFEKYVLGFSKSTVMKG